MFIVKCTNFGREPEWKSGVKVSTAEIQVAGFSVVCACGAIVAEEDEVLREGANIEIKPGIFPVLLLSI